MVEGHLEPAQPIAVTLAASSETIDAFLGAKRGSPRIMTDETKLAITDCASRDPVRPVTFQAVRHCSLLLTPAHFGRMQTRRIVTSTSIERGSTSGIQRRRDDDTKAYGARTWS